MEEIWKPVVGYEGWYEVSNLGRVRRDNIDMIDKKGNHRVFEKALRKPSLEKQTGYLKVGLSCRGKRKTRAIHRMVAEAFIPNPDNLPYVDHIDCNRTNNRVDNLRWVTAKGNLDHSVEVGNLVYGKHTRKALIRDDGVRYESIADAARDLDCSSSSISAAIVKHFCKGHYFTYGIK